MKKRTNTRTGPCIGVTVTYCSLARSAEFLPPHTLTDGGGDGDGDGDGLAIVYDMRGLTHVGESKCTFEDGWGSIKTVAMTLFRDVFSFSHHYQH
jgi:hypothetical protein